MRHFDNNIIKNLLPYDGEVNYYGKILKQKEAQKYFDCMLNTIQWKHDEAIILGKLIITKKRLPGMAMMVSRKDRKGAKPQRRQ